MPQFPYITEQRAWEAVVDTDRRFKSRELPAEAYAYWEARGVDVATWVLADFGLHDEGPCYRGHLIAPDGRVFCYVVDVSEPEVCEWRQLEQLPPDSRHPANMGRLLVADR